MQAIDVLRDQRVQFTAPLQRDDGFVSCVGPRFPCRMHQPRLPGFLAYLRIGHVIADVGQLFRFGIARPKALRPTKIRYARLGGDARAREQDHALGRAHPIAHLG